jgi:hypothetical protein
MDGVADSTGRKTKVSTVKIASSTSESIDLRRLINVLGSNWELKRSDLINNNTIEITLSRVENRDSIAGFLIVNQTGISGWNLSRANSAEVQIVSSANKKQQINGVPTRLIIPLDGGFSGNDYRLRLNFNPEFSLLGYYITLSTLFWVSMCFIVFWLSISVYLNIRIWYGYFK